MPKLKTKSGAKRRFKVPATGKVMAAQRGKRHGMIKRTKKQIRQLRGTRGLFKTDGANIKKYFLPNACSRSPHLQPSRVRAAIQPPHLIKELRHVSRQTRCDLSRQTQESL